MTSVVAIDMSKVAAGVAVGTSLHPPRTAIRESRGHSIGESCFNCQTWARDLFLMEKPRLVVIEAPLVHAGPQSSAQKVRVILGLMAILHVEAHRRGAKVIEVGASTWRKAIYGNGRPKDPKRAALDFCASLGWDVGGSHDRAEAACVWCWAQLVHGDTAAMHRLLARQNLRLI